MANLTPKVIDKWFSKCGVRPPPPKVVDQEVVWVRGVGDKVRLKEHPYRVWTLYNEINPLKKPKLPIQPKHNRNAFMEDYVHDWTYRNGVFSYNSHVMDAERRDSDGAWILIEYADRNPFQSK
jgi:hypothetical protein